MASNIAEDHRIEALRGIAISVISLQRLIMVTPVHCTGLCRSFSVFFRRRALVFPNPKNFAAKNPLVWNPNTSAWSWVQVF
jgi:hypothetical protein